MLSILVLDVAKLFSKGSCRNAKMFSVLLDVLVYGVMLSILVREVVGVTKFFSMGRCARIFRKF